MKKYLVVENMKEKLYLIDGTALLYRAYFAFIRNPLINSKQENTSAIFGVLNSFITLVDKMDAAHVAIAFDRKAPTFRHQDYEAYKANRPPMPDDLQSQIEPVYEFFRLINVPQVGADGYEADDALGTMGARFCRSFDIVYVTSDKDYCQLVDETAVMYDPMKDRIMDAGAVYEKYGVHPQQFVDYLALVGDSSDNIPGVRGIGPVAATKLLQEFESLASIYKQLEDVEPKYRKKLEENKENAFLSQHLARIVRDADLPMPASGELSFDASRLKEALPLLKRYEITSLQRKIEARIEADKPAESLQEEQADIFVVPAAKEEEKARPDSGSTAPFEAVKIDRNTMSSLLQELAAAKVVSLDTETDSLDARQAKLVGISLCLQPQKAYYLPLGHQMEDNLPPEKTLSELFKALQGKEIIGHNLKYDFMVLRPYGFEVPKKFFDTMIAAYILDAGSFNLSLDECARKELDYKMMPIQELIGKGKKQISFDLVSQDDACFYAAEDAWAAFQLREIYVPRLAKSPARDVFYRMDLPLLPVLMKMEDNGVSIDEKILSDISHNLNIQIKSLSDDLYKAAGYEFNLNSTQQLAKLLFEELGLPSKKKTKSGYSTDNSVLEALSEEYEIAQKIIDYRQMVKLESTYVSALPKLVNPHTGRIHSSFNQCVASTGRLSSTNPNLQNIPIRTKIGREIRKAFVAADDSRVILAADYSQIELRLLALMSGDKVLIQAFKDNVDIHRQTAAQINSISIGQVSDEQRRAAKTINFGLLYGMGARKLARDLSISQTEAKTMIESYFAQFPSIRDYRANCIAQAQAEGQARTIFGRVLDLPGIHSKNKGIQSEAERVAVNMPIQGSAADIIKRAMLSIHAEIRDDERIKMILQVHDELVFEVSKDYVDKATDLVQKGMEGAMPSEYAGVVRLVVDIGVGKNWFEAH
ncbi:MAG: DNA polymerase I [Candidatus Cloacimonetes bacterium]|nr:DNA polymerase I [Candidatus Cloacimonadota bacterium]